MKLFGLGLSLAILVDAFLIRATLVPAFMRLAGRANWWAPKFAPSLASPVRHLGEGADPDPRPRVRSAIAPHLLAEPRAGYTSTP